MGYFILVVVLISYGSLYPFNFSLLAADQAAISEFIRNWNPITSRLDMLGNVLLFVPLGLVSLMQRTRDRSGRVLAQGYATLVVLVVFAGLLLALMLQLTQLLLPSRNSALADVLWNGVGLGVGLLLDQPLRAFFGRRQRHGHRHGSYDVRQAVAEPAAALNDSDDTRERSAALVALIIIGAWLLAQLLPLVPMLDVQSIKDSLKPLLLEPELHVLSVLTQASGVLLLGNALRVITKTTAVTGMIVLGAVLIATLAGKVLVHSNTVTLSTVVGFTIGGLLWPLVAGWPADRRALLITLTLLLAYTLNNLAPFELRLNPRPFEWVPFAQLLEGSMRANLQALAEKGLVYLGVLWLMLTARGRLLSGVISLTLWVLLLEFVQMMIVGRSAGISEPVLVLLCGIGLATVTPRPPPEPTVKRRRKKRRRRSAQDAANNNTPNPQPSRSSVTESR